MDNIFIVVNRDQHSRDFTILSNQMLRDISISYHARYLMTWLLSYNPKPGFKYSFEYLSRKIGMPLSRVRTCVQELQDKGYLKLERTRNGARFGNYVWHIDETPIKSVKKEAVQEDDTPINAEVISTEQFNFDQPQVISTSEYNFNRIWEAYPTQKRCDRRAAMQAFNQIPNANDIIEDILEGLHEMKGKENWLKEGGKWIPGLPKFLENHIWEEGLKNPSSFEARNRMIREVLENARL